MDGYGKRVLVVDDDETARTLIGILLEDAGYNVVPVCDGLEAWHEVTRRHFDAIVTDFFMPGLNGRELLGRTHQAHPEIPVILVSGAFDDQPAAGKACPFFACLRKPFEKDVLLELVRSAVELPATNVSSA